EDDLGDSGGLRAVGQERADRGGEGALGAFVAADRRVHGRRRHEGAAGGVVDDLGEHVTQRARHHETRTRLRAEDVLAYAEVTARLADAARRSNAATPTLEQSRAHFLPAFPALRRMTSPWYRTPLPLYGSGGRILRMFAATSPTSCLSMPATWNSV